MLAGLRKVFGIGISSTKGISSSSDQYVPPSHYPIDWWQKNMPEIQIGDNTTVEACVSTIAQSIAMLPIQHIRIGDDGGKTEVITSAVTRVMRKPNPFQTKSEFLVDIVRKMLLTGNGYAVATRNNRFEINALYPQFKMSAFVSSEMRDVYYSGVDSTLVDLENMIPSRNVLHIKPHTNSHPLIGETPLTSAMLSGAIGNSVQGHTSKFFDNMARPSGVLATDMTLTKEQTAELRTRFNEVTKDIDTGGVPILTSGLKYEQISMSAVDAEIIETYKMSVSDIARVFRVPLELIGASDKPTAGSTENLMRFFVTTGLGFYIEHLENSLEKLFDLPANERIEFDTSIILEATLKDRYDAYKVAVTGGFMTPNESRNKEGLKPLDGGDKLYMQMQNVPIELTGKKLEADIEAVKASTELLENPPEPIEPKPDDQAPTPEEAKGFGQQLEKLKGVKL